MISPFISVVMPVYCGQKYLPAALQSLVNQRDFKQNFEVIVAVDDSLKETRDILLRFSSLLPLKIIEGTKSKNWVSTTNKALRECSGEWICFLHQDDLFSEYKFSFIERLAEEHTSASLIIHPITYIDPENKSLGRPFLPFPYKPLLSGADIFSRLICQNIIMVPGVVFKRSLMKTVGFLDEKLRYTADWEYWLRCVRVSSVAYDINPLASFRVHKESQTIQLAEKQAEYYENLKIVVDKNIQYLEAYYGKRKSKRIERMARFGIEFNRFLSAKGVGLKPSFRKLINDIFDCGLYNFICYFIWAKVFERVLPRLIVGVKGKNNEA